MPWVNVMRALAKVIPFPQQQPVKATSMVIPDGDAGVQKTISIMRQAANAGARDPRIRQQALQIVSGVQNRDSNGELQEVYDWVKANVAFRGEYDEVIQSPDVTLRFGAGDCDDHAVLLAALLGSIGYQVRFKCVAVHGEPDLTHVYAEALNPQSNQWVALDTTVAQASPGWEPADVTREQTFQAIGNLQMMPRPRIRMRGPAPRPRRRIGDWQSALADDITAASPLINAASEISAQDYYRNLYNLPPGSSYGTTVGLQFQPLPGGAAVIGISTLPSWFWPTVLIGGGFLLAIKLSRGGRR